MSADPYAVPDSAAHVVWRDDPDCLIAILERDAITLLEGGRDPVFIDRIGSRVYLSDVVSRLRATGGAHALYHAYQSATR